MLQAHGARRIGVVAALVESQREWARLRASGEQLHHALRTDRPPAPDRSRGPVGTSARLRLPRR